MPDGDLAAQAAPLDRGLAASCRDRRRVHPRAQHRSAAARQTLSCLVGAPAAGREPRGCTCERIAGRFPARCIRAVDGLLGAGGRGRQQPKNWCRTRAVGVPRIKNPHGTRAFRAALRERRTLQRAHSGDRRLGTSADSARSDGRRRLDPPGKRPAGISDTCQ